MSQEQYAKGIKNSTVGVGNQVWSTVRFRRDTMRDQPEILYRGREYQPTIGVSGRMNTTLEFLPLKLLRRSDVRAQSQCGILSGFRRQIHFP